MDGGLWQDSDLGEPSWWPALGFRADPYATGELEGDEESLELLVGRDESIVHILEHLRASSTHLTIDGSNGCGKTSLLRCVIGALERSVERFTAGQLLVPVGRPISPASGQSPEEFAERAMLAIALALVEKRRVIGQAGGGSPRRLKALKKLARNPLIKSMSGGFTFAGLFGLSGSGIAAPNASRPFQLAGLETLLVEALEQAFSADEAGAIVVCIDDAEKLGGSSDVADFMSAVREPLFGLRGVKWVILGSGGAVDALSGHRRLAGVLSAPMRLPELAGEKVPEVVERRIANYRVGSRVSVPVDGEGFRRFYEATGCHLRLALELCQDFALHASAHGALDGDRMASPESSPASDFRSDVAPDEIAAFLETECLRRWHQIGLLGKSAADVLSDVAAAGTVRAKDLTRKDAARKDAMRQLLDKNFLAITNDAGGGARFVVCLTAAGHLAVEGGHRAGWAPTMGL